MGIRTLFNNSLQMLIFQTFLKKKVSEQILVPRRLDDAVIFSNEITSGIKIYGKAYANDNSYFRVLTL